MAAENIPESFLCPISHQIMKDPYVDSDGNSYDREHIMNWLTLHETSPITRNPLTTSALVPNRVLKSLIMDFMA